uniref:Uncharacterized protein n=1 Tax=Magnetococcus massalia (strain MO-1) TaxID=451514 RepID=A0A1S7LJ82_MAGMO|nr:protein of unknown function [Candidatus Magnetococcus massalia]
MTEEYSDERRNEIGEKVHGWGVAFTRSDHFEGLSKVEKEESEPVIIRFADYMYSHLGLAPEAWCIESMVECCTEILPRKVTAEPEFYESVAPVLSAFFRFLDEDGILPSATLLAQKVDPLGPEIAAIASDPANWGPAKSFAMKAQAAGVVMGSQEEINRFMLQYNQQLLGEKHSSAPMEGSLFSEPSTVSSAPPQGRKSTKKKRAMQKASRRKNRR